jgi:hypothetical protein
MVVVGLALGRWIEHRSIAVPEKALADQKAKMESLDAFIQKIRQGLYNGEIQTHMPPKLDGL